jgi:adenylate kinase
VGRLVLVLGTSGAGKSTLGEAMAAALGVGYVYASGAKLAMVEPGEAINLYGQEQTDALNERMFASLPDGPGDTLVDTHAVYPVGDGFVRLTPASVAPRVSAIVLVEADPDAVRERRIRRGRPTEATEPAAIERELAAERAEVDRLARTHGIPVCLIDSVATAVADSVAAVAAFLAALPRADAAQAGGGS